MGVALANAPGTGVADDKVIGSEMIIPNVETYMCWDDSDRKYVFEHMHEPVIKTANDYGGYGVLVGPHATTAVLKAWAYPSGA